MIENKQVVFEQTGHAMLHFSNFAQENNGQSVAVFGTATVGGQSMEAMAILALPPEAFSSEDAYSSQRPIAIIPRPILESMLTGWSKNREMEKAKKPSLSLATNDGKKLH
jgi:hypothetical protein